MKEEDFFLPEKGMDAHAHLPWTPERGACVLNATRPEEWAKVAFWAREYPQLVIPAFGVHPWVACEVKQGWQEELRAYLEAFPRGWVGEVGLDKSSRHKGSLVRQKEVLCEQLNLACEYERPVSLHLVGSAFLVLALLKELEEERGGRALPFVLCHGYNGPLEAVKPLLGLNAYFSLTEEAWTSEKGCLLRALIPPSHCLNESDS